MSACELGELEVCKHIYDGAKDQLSAKHSPNADAPVHFAVKST